MRKFLHFFCLWIAFFAAVPLSAAPIDHVLWKIEKNGQPVSYLAGTVHFGYSGTSLHPQIKNALLQSKTLMTEVVIPLGADDAFTAEYAAVALQMFNLNDPATARSRLGEKLYGDLKRIFAQNPELAKILPVYDFMYPWAVYVNLSAAAPAGMDAQSGIDYLLSKAAAENRIRRKGLESYQAALSIFSAIPEDILLRDLRSSVQYAAQLQAETAALVDNYRRGKIAALLAEQRNDEVIFQYTAPQDKAFWKNFYYETLLNRRNRAWLPQILAQLPQEPTFIAVGLMHLDNDNGLIRLLRDKGYTVTPLPLRY